MKIGQRVICVKVGKVVPTQTNTPPLRLGATYTVQGMLTCPDCGIVKLDVGLGHVGLSRCFCLSLQPDDGVWWCAASRFRAVEERGKTMVESILRPEEIKAS